jgi:hypothetical protein
MHALSLKTLELIALSLNLKSYPLEVSFIAKKNFKVGVIVKQSVSLHRAGNA